jgi:hypothetical protein
MVTGLLGHWVTLVTGSPGSFISPICLTHGLGSPWSPGHISPGSLVSGHWVTRSPTPPGSQVTIHTRVKLSHPHHTQHRVTGLRPDHQVTLVSGHWSRVTGLGSLVLVSDPPPPRPWSRVSGQPGHWVTLVTGSLVWVSDLVSGYWSPGSLVSGHWSQTQTHHLCDLTFEPTKTPLSK